MLKNKMR